MRRRYFNCFNSRLFNKIIIYTSLDNLIVVPNRYDFGANAITNTMSNNIGKITFNNNVTTIGYEAFSNCYSLTSVTIPDSTTTIGDSAFASCTSLTSVTIGNSVTTIGYNAFFLCESLTSLTIPDSVTTIGNYAFANCYSLTSVYCKPTTPPSIIVDSYGGYWDAFDYNASCRMIYVPAESVEAYKSAEGWSEYADAIVGYNF